MFKRYENGLEGLNWTVNAVPVYTKEGLIEGFAGIQREDTGKVLSIMSDRYVPIQTVIVKELSELIPGVAEAGEIHDGRVAYASVQYDSEFRIPGVSEDFVRQRIHIVTSHDGSIPVTGGYSGIRPVCQNTLYMATREARKNNWFKIRHTLEADGKLKAVKRILADAVADFKNLKEACEILARTPANAEKMDTYFKSLVYGDSKQAENRRERMKELLEHPSNSLVGMRGTMWQAYNAATHYFQHESGTRGKDDSERLDNKAFSNFLGRGADFTRNAMAEALVLT